MMDKQKSTVSASSLNPYRLNRYEVTLTYRVTVEAPSEEDAIMDARYIVECDYYDDGLAVPDVTVRAPDHSDLGR